jgi:hypothetical protein
MNMFVSEYDEQRHIYTNPRPHYRCNAPDNDEVKTIVESQNAKQLNMRNAPDDVT